MVSRIMDMVARGSVRRDLAYHIRIRRQCDDRRAWIEYVLIMYYSGVAHASLERTRLNVYLADSVGKSDRGNMM